MSLAQEFFPKLSGGKTFVEEVSPRAAEILENATRAATSHPAWESLTRVNSQTGEPEGSVAIMKEQMLAMLMLRAQKIFSGPYRMRLA